MTNKRNLRTFDNYASFSFEPDPFFDQSQIKKFTPDVSSWVHKRAADRLGAMGSTKKTLFALENVLTPLECNSLIKKSDPFYETLSDEYVAEERDSQRVLTTDELFADVLYTRISSFVSTDEKSLDLKPCGFGTDGEWTATKINSCFRYCKYIGPSLGFSPHRDATFIENENIRSILTVIIYLNDEYKRGSTIFYKTHNKRTPDQIVSDEMKNGFHERFNYQPKAGSVLIFNHNMIHAGDGIDLGDTKYIIRSDVVFSCKRFPDYNHNWQQNPDFLKCIELYREAFNQELDGNKKKASVLYQKALALRQTS